MKMKYHFLGLAFLLLLFNGCKSDPVEDYFVEATESPDFFVVNIPANFITFDESKLDEDTKKQLKSIKKINILVYRNDYDIKKKKREFDKAAKLLNRKQYKTLLKINNEGYEVVFTYEGNPRQIDQLLFLGKDQNYNFILGRLKGQNLNIKNLSKALKHVKQVNKSQAQPLLDIIKKES
jgi:hypothetical protein